MIRAAVFTIAASIAVLGTPALVGTQARAQSPRACPHAESDRDKITRTVSAASSCKAAYDLMNACRSNTGGDVELAEIVITRCEASFLPGLDAKARKAYQDERAACQRKYAKSRGTMYVSFAVTCEAGVAANYAGVAERRSRGR